MKLFKKRFKFSKLLLPVLFLASVAQGASKDNAFTQNALNSKELVIELDPSQYNERAREHDFQVLLEADMLLQGRLGLKFNAQLTKHIGLFVPVYVDYDKFSQLDNILRQFESAAPHYFSVMAGLGAKFRLSEWTMKSSFYVAPSVVMGHSNTFRDGDAESVSALRVTPGLTLGWERVYNSGFTIGAALTVDRPFDVSGGSEFNDIDVSVGVVTGYSF